MSAAVWSHRGLGRNQYEVLRGRDVALLVALDDPVERPATMIRHVTEAVARAHGEPVAADSAIAASVIDWPSLGWSNRYEHDEMVAEVQALQQAWAGHEHAARFDAHVKAEIRRAGLPNRLPYSVADLDEVDRIIRRTPEIVLQDIDAERGAA